jgi:hypothetical protein
VQQQLSGIRKNLVNIPEIGKLQGAWGNAVGFIDVEQQTLQDSPF